MSLGATMAWTICTNRAGVWIVRPTLVFLTVASFEILLRLAIFELFPVFESFTASAAPGVLPRKCKGMREYLAVETFDHAIRLGVIARCAIPYYPESVTQIIPQF